jgi:hypothetical protein
MDRVDRKLEFLQVASEGILEQTGGALDEQRHLWALLLPMPTRLGAAEMTVGRLS